MEILVKKHPNECPFIDRSVPDPAFNKPIDYEGYIFYDHHDSFGVVPRVQFCQLIGRKRDVFECLNDSEWHACPHYRAKTRTTIEEE